MQHKIVINFPRTQRLGWYGHTERIKETGMVNAINSWEPISKKPMGRPKICWEDDVKKRYTEVKSAKLEDPCPGRIEEDGRKWLGRPKLCPKSCRAVLRGRRV